MANEAKKLEADIGVTKPKNAKGPPCRACGCTEYVRLGGMARAVERVECYKCGETDYLAQALLS